MFVKIRCFLLEIQINLFKLCISLPRISLLCYSGYCNSRSYVDSKQFLYVLWTFVIHYFSHFIIFHRLHNLPYYSTIFWRLYRYLISLYCYDFTPQKFILILENSRLTNFGLILEKVGLCETEVTIWGIIITLCKNINKFERLKNLEMSNPNHIFLSLLSEISIFVKINWQCNPLQLTVSSFLSFLLTKHFSIRWNKWRT